MKLAFKSIYLKKRFPLAISRGINRGAENLFVSFTHNGVTGWGELSPGKSEGAESAASAQKDLTAFARTVPEHASIYQIWDLARPTLSACALAGLDIALWDWLGKTAHLPLYQLLGIGKPTIPTSITIGINPPEVVRERIPLLLKDRGIKFLKVKLGSPEGIAADQAMYAQVVESTAAYDVRLRVDANGGWEVDDARLMMKWLAERGADYIEQPLAEGREAELAALFHNRPLPIYVDESCRFSGQIPHWADRVDGVNIKLMKCGGITEALRIIAVARAFGLKTMLGCMGESSMSISAAAAISGLVEHIDLDSHLNLDPDPCTGPRLINGIIMPNILPGHGTTLKPLKPRY